MQYRPILLNFHRLVQNLIGSTGRDKRINPDSVIINFYLKQITTPRPLHPVHVFVLDQAGHRLPGQMNTFQPRV